MYNELERTTAAHGVDGQRVLPRRIEASINEHRVLIAVILTCEAA